MVRLSPVELHESGVPAPLALRENARRPAPVGIPLPEGTSDASNLRRPGRRRTARSVPLIVALLMAGGGTVYWFLAPPSIAVVHPRRGEAVQAVYATGTVEPTVMVPIAPRTAGRLVALAADEGTLVAKGQLLARLEDDDLRRAIDVAAAEERYAKAAFDRQAVLVERQAASRSAYDRAKADWEKARAAADRASAEAGFLQLVAPADGTVIRRDGEIGQMIAANQTVFWLRCCAPLRIAAEVDEEDIGQVRPAQEVLIRADAFPGELFRGEVQSVTPKGDPVARSYRVRIALSEDTPLMIGMTTETNIVLRKTDSALLLPVKAVQQDWVWRVNDGRLARQHVTLGAKGANEVEIREGISDGDWIVADPAASLKAGQSVHPAPVPGQQ